MDPLTGAILGILILIVIGGVWGYTVIAGIMRQRSLRAGVSVDPARLENLLEDHRLLEARLERIEEELGFFRELHGPRAPGELPPARADDGG